jgi:hypothetical protein
LPRNASCADFVVLDPFRQLWLLEQIPPSLVALGLFSSAAWAPRRLRLLNVMVGLTLSVGLGLELTEVLSGGLPTATGTWDPPWRWWLMAGLIGWAHRGKAEPRLASILGGVALGWATSWVVGVVAVAKGLFDAKGSWRLGLSTAALLAAAWLAGSGGGWVPTVLAKTTNLGFDGTTVASAIIVGLVEGLGWAGVLMWAQCLDQLGGTGLDATPSGAQ